MVAGAGGLPAAGGAAGTAVVDPAAGAAGTAVVDPTGAFDVGVMSILVTDDTTGVEGHSVVYK